MFLQTLSGREKIEHNLGFRATFAQQNNVKSLTFITFHPSRTKKQR